jgi:hypothetical protein
MGITKVLKETFFIPKSGSLNRARHRAYVTALWTIVALHFIVACATLFATFYRNDNDQNAIAYFFTLLQGLSVASGLLIVFLSLKSEVLIAQTYEFAVSATQAASHEFETFTEQIAWLRDNLSPDRFPETQKICFTISTPIYGIGAQDGSVIEFLDYLESWIKHFEDNASRDNPSPPIWEISVWNKNDNIATFGTNHFSWDDPLAITAKSRFSKLLERMYCLHRERRVDLRLFFTDVSHSRLFLIQTKTEKCCGLLVLFPPLTPSAITTKNWILVGFSFRDVQAFQNISRFNLRLQRENHALARPENKVDVLSAPDFWINDHYGLQAKRELK